VDAFLNQQEDGLSFLLINFAGFLQLSDKN